MSAKFSKNGVINCTPIDGYDKVSILKNDIVVGENVLTKTDLINKTSSDIWTKTGGVTIDNTNGRVTIPSSNTQQCEFYRNDWTTLEANTDYICSFYIHSNTLTPSQSNRYLTYWLACNNNGTANWQFKTGHTNKTGLFYFTFNTGTYTQFRLDIGSDVKSTGSAVISKIKIEKDSNPTPWCPNPADGFGDTPDTYKNPIQARDFIEL